LEVVNNNCRKFIKVRKILKIMRKIYGPTRTEDGYWKIKTNQEINDILKDKI
jgi:hypothetical protein